MWRASAPFVGPAFQCISARRQGLIRRGFDGASAPSLTWGAAPARQHQAPSFADVRSYSGVHRSGMSSDAGGSVDRSLIAHRQCLNRGDGTSTVPNSDLNRRARVSFSGRRLWQCEQRRRSAL